MKTLTWEQASEWTNNVGLNANVTRVTNKYIDEGGKEISCTSIQKSVCFPNEDPARRFTLSLPKLPYQVSYLANALLPYSSDACFQPCLLWITDWGILSEASERVAKSLVQGFRSARGESQPLIETPGHLFGEPEVVDAQTLFTLTIVFGWDCYVIPQHGQYYALTSHDEYLEVVSSTTEINDNLARELAQWL